MRALVGGRLGCLRRQLRVRVNVTAPTTEEARAIAAQVRVETDGTIRVTGPESRTRDRNWWASIRLDVRRIGAVKEGTESVGNRTRVRVEPAQTPQA